MGELGQHVGVEARDLGDAVLGRLPADTQAASHLCSQVGVIESGQGALVELDGAGVKSEPAAIRRRHPVGDHRMGVQLGIELPARVLSKHTHHDPLGVHTHDVAVVTHSGVGVGLDPAEHRLHRTLVGFHHLTADLLIADTEED